MGCCNPSVWAGTQEPRTGFSQHLGYVMPDSSSFNYLTFFLTFDQDLASSPGLQKGFVPHSPSFSCLQQIWALYTRKRRASVAIHWPMNKIWWGEALTTFSIYTTLPKYLVAGCEQWVNLCSGQNSGEPAFNVSEKPWCEGLNPLFLQNLPEFKSR